MFAAVASLAVALSPALPVLPPPEEEPAAILDGVPADALGVLFVSDVGTSLQPCIDALPRLFGAAGAEDFLVASPLPFLAARELLDGREDAWLDPRSGIALFWMDGFPGAVGVVSVRQPRAAVDALLTHLAALGVIDRGVEQGVHRLSTASGEEIAVFTRRGFLYFAFPSDGSVPLLMVRAHERDLQEVVGELAVPQLSSLSADPIAREVIGNVGGGALKLYLRPSRELGVSARGLALSIAVEEDGATLDGFIRTDDVLWTAANAPAAPTELRWAPDPVAVLRSRVPLAKLARALLGATRGPLRTKMEALLPGSNAALEALTGDATIAVYADPDAWLSSFLGDAPTAALFGVRVDAGVSRARRGAVAKWIELAALATGGASGEVRVLARHGRVDASSNVDASASGVDLLAPLSASPRLDDAFGPGHVTLALDVGRLRSGIAALTRSRQLTQAELRMAKDLLLEAIDEATNVDTALLDLAPDKRGLRLRGVLRYRPATPDVRPLAIPHRQATR